MKKKRDFNAFDKMFEDSIKALNGLINSTNEIMPLAAIWLEQKHNGKVRLTEGDCIRVVDGKLADGDYATHKIIGCFGDVYSNHLEFLATDVITNEPDVIVIT